MDEQSIFQQALDQPAGQPRAMWLDEVCGVGSPLRERIDALLDELMLTPTGSEIPAEAPPGSEDLGPLESPIDEEFRVGVIGLAYVSDRQLIEIDMQAIAESQFESDEGVPARKGNIFSNFLYAFGNINKTALLIGGAALLGVFETFADVRGEVVPV